MWVCSQCERHSWIQGACTPAKGFQLKSTRSLALVSRRWLHNEKGGRNVDLWAGSEISIITSLASALGVESERQQWTGTQGSASLHLLIAWDTSQSSLTSAPSGGTVWRDKNVSYIKKKKKGRGWLCRERAKTVARGRGGVAVDLALSPHVHTALIQHKENVKCMKQARLNHYSQENTSQAEKDLNNEGRSTVPSGNMVV